MSFEIIIVGVQTYEIHKLKRNVFSWCLNVNTSRVLASCMWRGTEFHKCGAAYGKLRYVKLNLWIGSTKVVVLDDRNALAMRWKTYERREVHICRLKIS